jgi:predicted nucleotidyltransferase
MTPDLLAFVRILSDAGVDYVIVGGVAASIHGALRTTLDLDIVYSRVPANVARLAQALSPYQPYLRGAPPGLPFVLDEATIHRGLNFTLTTTLGDVDLLGEVTGGGRFEALIAQAEPVELEERCCRVVTLPALIALKRAAGRAKDRESLAELEALLEERDSI